MNILKGLLGASLLVGSLGAQAASISFDTDTYGGGSTIGLTTTNWDTTSPLPNPMFLPKWDPTLVGDPAAFLTGITINVRGDGSFSYKIENTSATSASSGTNELLVNIDFTLPCGACPAAVAVSSGVLGINLTTFDGTFDYNGTSGIDFGTTSGSASDSLNILAANWAFYVGLGDFTIDAAAGSDSDRQLSGGELAEVTTWQGGAWAEVIYSYETQRIPVPMPLALLGLGLVGMVIARKRS
jgi:hypothetical protein